MVQVEVREQINAAIGTVWESLRDFSDVSAWAPDATILAIESEGVGAMRTIEAGGAVVIEECVLHDDEAHCFSYAIVESPYPVEHYRATVRLEPLEDGRCEVIWSGEFECAEAVRQQLVEGLEKLYRDAFIASLKKRFRRRPAARTAAKAVKKRRAAAEK